MSHQKIVIDSLRQYINLITIHVLQLKSFYMLDRGWQQEKERKKRKNHMESR